MVEASWKSSEGGLLGNTILAKIKQCGKDLDWWNRKCFGNVRRELEKKKSPFSS